MLLLYLQILYGTSAVIRRDTSYSSVLYSFRPSPLRVSYHAVVVVFPTLVNTAFKQLHTIMTASPKLFYLHIKCDECLKKSSDSKDSAKQKTGLKCKPVDTILVYTLHVLSVYVHINNNKAQYDELSNPYILYLVH